jgi:glycosyltransferase involved in cell wall biosynthesis
MRILYHHRTQAEDAQGVHIHEIIRNLKALGHEVREVALVPAEDGPHTSSERKEKGGGWAWIARMVPSVVYELMEMAYNFVGKRNLTRAVGEFKPDFIYERYSLYTSCGVQVARRAGIPLILEINAPLSIEQEKAGKLTFWRRARRTEAWIASHASRAITVSTPMKEIFVDMGVPADNIEVISNGVDPDQFHGRDTSAAVKAKYGLERKQILGFVGWIREWHGLIELAEAMGTWSDLPDVHLLIVGDGPARPALESAAVRAGVRHRLHVTGPVQRADMPDHIAAFDVALQPAATPYASPMKVFEYLAMGKPVVACRQPNLEEILTEGENALLFGPGDPKDLERAVREILNDEPRRKRMGKKARQTIFDRGYLWKRNAQRAVDLARDEIAKRRPRNPEEP